MTCRQVYMQASAFSYDMQAEGHTLKIIITRLTRMAHCAVVEHAARLIMYKEN
jgi:hypothetical protein